MPNSVDFSGKPFHFIGIGGIGMSALAYVLAKRQIPVSGSDINVSHITQRLQAVGAHIFRGQEANNLKHFLLENVPVPVASSSSRLPDNKQVSALPQVICSTAINTANSEYQAALDLGCPVFHRADLLAALIKDYQSIAVAGTHGKTTTSSMIGYMLVKAGLDPTIIVGGEVNAWEGNARLGKSPYLVAEADESDGSLVKLAPHIGVITNIELDHPDHYENLEEVINTFQIFAQHCPVIVGCIDCATVKEHLKPKISYSLQFSSDADYTVDDVTFRADGTTARVWERGKVLGYLNLKLLGKHNLSNALAAIAVGRYLNLEFETIALACASFEGARRRFELKGEGNGIYFVDDYAHHPSEICATLAAARLQVKPPRRLVAVFQPHRYSRTLTFLKEFASSFNDADIVVISDIYSAGEPNLGQIDGEKVAKAISVHHQQVHYQPTLPDISKFLEETLRPGDLALFLGAGNLNKIIPELIAFYQNKDKERK